MANFAAATRYYTQYDGKRCALPLLADTYGLYYNKKLFEEAGIDGPPKTISELTDAAKKLTKRNADGTIKVAGFDPIFGFYENAVAGSRRCSAPSGSTRRASRTSRPTRPGRRR